MAGVLGGRVTRPDTSVLRSANGLCGSREEQHSVLCAGVGSRAEEAWHCTTVAVNRTAPIPLEEPCEEGAKASRGVIDNESRSAVYRLWEGV